MARILIVDDADRYAELCRRHLPEHDWHGPVRDGLAALEELERAKPSFDLVLLDVHFDIADDRLLMPPGRDETPLQNVERRRIQRTQGFLILQRIRERFRDLPVVVMTSRQDLPPGDLATRLVAEDMTYLLDDEYLDARALKIQVGAILERQRRDDDENFFWGKSPAMGALRRRLRVLARGRLPILIHGETGTGKSLLAREVIHPATGRSGDFVSVDLSAIPQDLVAAHLFGVVKGAFTGAQADREGVLERANGGTLFLDEIGNLSPELQKSLLLVLQDRKYRPLGSVRERSADVKLIAATHENLEHMVEAGSFRADLWMRLNPSTAVTLPSMADRQDDLTLLLRYFMQRVCADEEHRELLQRYAKQRSLRWDGEQLDTSLRIVFSIPEKSLPGVLNIFIHPSTLELLSRAKWPGNFRQFEMFLSNVLTLTLVELVEANVEMEPSAPIEQRRADLIVVQPGAVMQLHVPDALNKGSREATELIGEDEDHGPSNCVKIHIRPQDTLNAVSSDVERQYLRALYTDTQGSLSKMAKLLLEDADAGRKVQLRMNQLGLRLRSLREESS